MKPLFISFIIFIMSIGISRAEEPKESIPEVPAIPQFQIMHKKVQCQATKYMMAWLKRTGEVDFEYLGMQRPAPGFQVVVSITRNNKHGTFSVLETSNTGKSCIVTLGNFDGDVVEGTDKKL